MLQLRRRCEPNEAGEAYTGNHVARRGDRTPQSLIQPRKGDNADGDGFNAPEAYTEEAFFFGELSEGLSGSTLERGRRGEKRQELGRSVRFLLREGSVVGHTDIEPRQGKPGYGRRPEPTRHEEPSEQVSKAE